MNRESVVSNMEVSDADAVKAANSAFVPGEEVLPNDDWTDLEPDHVQRGAGGPLVKTTNKKTLCKGFATTSLEDSTTAGHMTWVANSARGNAQTTEKPLTKENNMSNIIYSLLLRHDFLI